MIARCRASKAPAAPIRWRAVLEALRGVGSRRGVGTRLAKVAPITALSSAGGRGGHACVTAGISAVRKVALCDRALPAESSAGNGSATTGDTAEAACYRVIGVCHAQAMLRVVGPNAIASDPAIAVANESVIAVVAEEEGALTNREAEPVWPPAPTSPTQTTPEAADVDAWAWRAATVSRISI